MNKQICKIGFWSGIIAFGSSVGYTVVQLLQLAGVLPYPWDEILIYGFSLCIVVPFLIEMLALHYVVPDEKKFWSHASLIFTIIYAIFVTSNYVVQLATVIPFTLRGASDEISMLIQTPHSLFWDFDAIGYIAMGLATLFALPIFKKEGFQKWIWYSFLAHSLATPLIAFVYFYPNFSERLLLIGLPWAITAPLFMLLLAMLFKKEADGKNQLA
jgi:hypothetical protein